MKDSYGRQIVLCWLCNGRLEYRNNILIYAIFKLPNGANVKMHKTCAEDYKVNPDSYWSQRLWGERGEK